MEAGQGRAAARAHNSLSQHASWRSHGEGLCSVGSCVSRGVSQAGGGALVENVVGGRGLVLLPGDGDGGLLRQRRGSKRRDCSKFFQVGDDSRLIADSTDRLIADTSYVPDLVRLFSTSQ